MGRGMSWRTRCGQARIIPSPTGLEEMLPNPVLSLNGN